MLRLPSSFCVEICLFGDSMATYSPTRDPRPLWGTYVKENLRVTSAFKETDPIYTHRRRGGDESTSSPPDVVDTRYIAHHKSLGWLLTANPPNSGSIQVLLFCTEESLLACTFGKWFWFSGGSLDYPMSTTKTTNMPCQSCVLGEAL